MGCIELNNTNFDICGVVPGYKIGGLVSNEPFKFTKAELEDEAAVKAKIIASAGRIFPVLFVQDYENIGQREPVTRETTNGVTKNLGITGHSFKVSNSSPDWYAVQKSIFNGSESADCYVLLVTLNGFYEGNENADGDIEARSFQLFKNLTEAEDKATEQMLNFIFTELKPSVNIKRMWYGQPDTYDITSLSGISDVTIEQNVADATDPVFTITKAGRAGNVPTTLGVDNFIVLDSSGVAQSVASVAYANGQYTVTATTTFTAGTIQVVPVVSDAIFYESEAIAFEIS